MGLTGAILDQLDQIGDWGLLATDTDLLVTHWNRWLEQRSGLAAADVVGRPLFDVFPDLVTRRLDRYYHQALTGQTVLLSQRFHKYVIPLPSTADLAGHAHVQQTSRIVPLVDGPTVCGTLTLIEDVTERVAYEAELRARARQQAAVAAVARSALGGQNMAAVAQEAVNFVRETLDVDFTEVLEAAPPGRAWGRLAGHGWADPPATTVEPAPAPRTQHLTESDRTGTAVGLRPADLAADAHLRSHGVAGGMVISVPGRGRPFGLIGAYTRYPRQFSPGEVLFAQALADVLGVAAERKQLESELRQRAEELALADQRKDEFLAMLAHELRNPLAPVQNALQILQLKQRGDPLVEQLGGMMRRQVGQLVRLVDDLLDVSRITRGKVQLKKERVELMAAVDPACEAARPLIDARHQTLEVSPPPAPVYLDADPIRLTQIVGNLLNNAAKYTEDGGRIWLTARREGGEVVVSVRDTGIGIPADMLPRVFDLFTQVDRTLDRSQGGLGIGLTLVRSLVGMHGGTVRATSAGPGRGSEFVVRLQVRPEASGESSDRHAGTAPPPVIPRRILIVDDNVDSADSLATLLTLTGHRAWTAHDGPAALQAVREHRPQVVLLDIGLPKMNGYEVARRLRQDPDPGGLTLIAMTGYGQEEDRRRSREAGFDFHLVKPVAAGELARLFATLGTDAAETPDEL